MTAKVSGLIYLQRDNFQIYTPYLPTVLEFRFVPEIVQDLDVVNKELLDNLIKVYIATNKLPPSNLSIVIADSAAFIKDFLYPPPTPQQPLPDTNAQEAMKVEADKFIEHVPFEDVVSKTLPLPNGLKVFTANKDLYESIKSAFEKNGFTVDAIIPGLLLGNNVSAKPVLDIQTATFMMTKIPALKENNLLSQPSVSFNIPSRGSEDEVEEVEPEGIRPNITMGMPEGKDKKRLFLMAGVFVILVIVLIVVYLQSMSPTPPPQATTNSQAPAAVQQSATTNTAPQAVTAQATIAPQATLEAKDLTVTILIPSNSLQSAQKLKTQLETSGFKTVQIQNQPTTGISQSSIVFSAKPSIAARDIIVAEVKKLEPEATIQEKKDSTTDISIVLVK